jgi:asparagine synthase (glutamine-hydrolysing)
MVLTGDGGDEVLSGYTGYQGEKFAERYQRIPAIIRKSVPALAGGIAAPFKGSLRYRLNRVKKVTSLSDKPFEQRLYAKIAWLEPALLKNLVTGTKEIIPFRDYLSDFMAGCTYKDSFYKLMYFHLKNSLPGDMLTKVDRMSMAHSIETRVPFLDHRLVEMMVRVHKDIKMEGSERKSVLRRTVARDLPPSLLSAGKKGFGVPLREWFKDKSFEHRLDQLHFNDLPLNGEVVKKIISDNRAGSKDYGNFIWMLFVLNKWMKNFG